MTLAQKLSARHTLAVMGFFGILNVYFSRIDMSIAIVAMVGRESVTKADSNVTLCDAGYVKLIRLFIFKRLRLSTT